MPNVSKTKTRDKTPDKARPALIKKKKKPKAPEKKGGPLPDTQAPELVASPEQVTRGARRARMMAAMQRRMGNARLGRLLDAPEAPVAAQPQGEQEEQGGATQLAQRQAEKEDGALAQPQMVQRQEEKGEEAAVQPQLVQRQEEKEEETPVQPQLVQRQQGEKGQSTPP
jgi:hypothetical protein